MGGWSAQALFLLRPKTSSATCHGAEQSFGLRGWFRGIPSAAKAGDQHTLHRSTEVLRGPKLFACRGAADFTADFTARAQGGHPSVPKWDGRTTAHKEVAARPSLVRRL